MFLLAINQSANNNELIKEMQDKVISLQDHEISFLNDTIANMWATVAIGVGIVVGIAGFIGWIIRRSNHNAEKKMQLAEQILGDAQAAKEELLEYKADLEAYREETKKEFEELTKLVNSEEIKKIKDDTKILYAKNKISVAISQIQGMINNGENMIEVLKQTGFNIQGKEFRDFNECKHKFQYLQIYSRHPLDEVSKAEYIASSCRELEKECFQVVIQLEKLWKQHYEENLAEGTENKAKPMPS